MRKKNSILFVLSIIFFCFSLLGVYIFAKAPDPGHQWNQIGCEGSSCNLIVDKDGNITSGINILSSSPTLSFSMGGVMRATIGMDSSGAYIKSGSKKMVEIGTTHFSINQKVKIRGINNEQGEVQMSCEGGKCYAVFAPPE